MSGPRWLGPEEQQAWRALTAVQMYLPGVLDAQLQRDAGLSHAEYVVLAMLSEAEDRSLRMSELAALANVSQSRLSHMVGRLEARGWVRRERSAHDGRGSVGVLTEAGWELVVRTAPGHAAAVREAVFDALTPQQVLALRDALVAVRERVERLARQPATRTTDT